MLGAGDKVFLEGVYSKGAVGYAILNGIGSTTAGVYADVNKYNWTADANAAANGDAKLTTAWSVTGGLNHNFSKTIEANLGASYAKVDSDGVAWALDYSQIIVGGDLRWKPAAGFYIAGAIDFRKVDFGATANAAGYRDNGAWLGTIRVQRSF
ncbi:MAG: hypothetical protein GX458_05415 [Phyllobacteriaceae bacterium]|nr:hypothetical protein [Phyllobacteriaceae bacterium]